MEASLKVEERRVEDLIPYVANSRTHSEEQVTQIAASIAEFGMVNPILVDGDGVIVAGHGRMMALKKLKRETAPVIVLSHLSDAQRRALTIADNKLALNAGWDEALLKSELDGLRALDFDLDLLGLPSISANDLPDFKLDGEEDQSGGESKNNLLSCPNCGHSFDSK